MISTKGKKCIVTLIFVLTD